MVDRRRRRAEDRPGRAAAEELHPAGGDAVQDQPHLHLRLRRVREGHGPGAQARRRRGLRQAPGGIEEARQAARARHVQHHRARRGGRLRGRRNPLRPRRHGARCSPAASTRARATRPRSSRSWPTGSASIPNDIEYIQGDTDKVFFGEGTGGSRSATMSGSAFHIAAEKIIAKAKAIAAHNLKVDVADVNFADGIFSSAKTNQTMTIKDVAQNAVNPAKLPKDMEAGLIATAVYTADVENFPNGCHVCEVEIDPETGAGRDRALQRGRRRRHGDQSAAAQGPDRRRRGAGRRPDPDGGHPLRRRGPARHRLVHGLRHAARARLLRRSRSRPIRCRPRPIRSASRARARPAASARMPAVANALVDALSEFGVRHIEMPATPEVVWRAMGNGKAG